MDVFLLNNKYKRWHDSIIEKAKNRTLTGYKEVHHIIPKSCGGNDDKSNLIQLTAKEHFIIHLLLTKCTVGDYKEKMIMAFAFMSVLRKDKINSKLYETHILEARKICSKKLTGRKISEKTKKKIKLARKKQICTQETRDKYSKIYSNLIWINKEGVSKRVPSEKKEFFISQGYQLGRDKSYIDENFKNKLAKIIKLDWSKNKYEERRKHMSNLGKMHRRSIKL